MTQTAPPADRPTKQFKADASPADQVSPSSKMASASQKTQSKIAPPTTNPSTASPADPPSKTSGIFASACSTDASSTKMADARTASPGEYLTLPPAHARCSI